jgi:hypothetical protein
MNYAGKENQSLLKIDKELSQWIHGPFIAMGVNGPFTTDCIPTNAPCYEQVYDLESIDLRHIVDRLRGEYFRSGMECRIYEEGSQEKAKGVRMNCLGDRDICCRRAYMPVDAVKSLCSEETDFPSPLVDKVGIPLVLRKLPQSMAWRGRHVRGVPCATSNGAALLDLHSIFELFKDPLHPMDIAYLTRKLEENAAGIGSCVVVRRDGQPLDHKLMYALETYGTLHTQ